jgi:hypothetical protein
MTYKTQQFTIKNLKYAEFASDDSLCFTATLYLDGKRFCTVSDNGNGGATDYYPIKAGSRRELDTKITQINADLNTIRCTGDFFVNENPSDSEKERDFVLMFDLDIVVNDLVVEELERRDTKKILKRICFVTPDQKAGVYSKFPATLKPTLENIARVKSFKTFPANAVVLNELSIADASACLNGGI